MQLSLFPNYIDYSGKKVLIGLSGGINSAAVLCWLAKQPKEFNPKELHLFYAHFEEHSPDTLDFVLDLLDYAKKHFLKVRYMQTNNSVLDFFFEQKMIPHPTIAPCTRILKIVPMMEYAAERNIDIDLVGYVKTEMRRIKNMHAKNPETKETKAFPIAGEDNEWCFELVKNELGWYPKIYDIRDKKGKRIFTHNNCLPCKNMQTEDFQQVKEFYPEYWQKAMDLSEKLNKHWGRKADVFYTTFGTNEYQPIECEVCQFD